MFPSISNGVRVCVKMFSLNGRSLTDTQVALKGVGDFNVSNVYDDTK